MDTKNEKKSGLFDSEWLIVITLLLLMFSMAVIAQVNAFRSSSLLGDDPFPSHALCAIGVNGEVARPGVYMVPTGTSIKKVIRKSRPTPFSDLKSVDLDRGVEKSENFNIPRLTEISVVLEGLLSGPKQIIIPAGTRMSQLKEYVDLHQEGVDTPIKNRRILRDGDVIGMR
jgi:hypothetical protein